MERQNTSKPKTVNNENVNKPSLIRQNGSIKNSAYSDSINPENLKASNSQSNGLFNHDFSSVPVGIQPKLKIGAANDKYEKEADRVADEVMRMPAPNLSQSYSVFNSNSINSIQRKYTSCNDEDKLVQRKTTQQGNSELSPRLNSQISSLSGNGRPMSLSERDFFEPRLNSDFSSVRLHDNSRANTLANSINARAFTYGNNIVFGTGEYSANTSSGRKLIAHELTHVLQQNSEQKSDSATTQNATSHQIQRDLMDDLLGAEGTQFVNDLGSTVAEAPNHFGEILGELVETILEHWVAFSATLLAIITIEGVIIALAAVPEPTTATKWAALILQALMLLIIGSIAAVELGQVATHTHRWLTATWEARGDPAKITEASKDFCRMLLHMVLLVLALIGVRARVPAVRGSVRSVRTPSVRQGTTPQSSQPVISGLARAREFGRALIIELQNMSSGKMTRLIERVNAEGFNQAEAVAAVEEASLVFGRTAQFPQANGTILVSSVPLGQSIPIFVVEANGNVFGATATMVVEGGVPVISNIRRFGG